MNDIDRGFENDLQSFENNQKARGGGSTTAHNSDVLSQGGLDGHGED